MFKHAAGKCRICGEPDYDLLDTHRILPGKRYTELNCVSLCVKCHRKIHTGQIVIDKYYETTAGRKLRIIEDGSEKFL